MPSLPSRIKQAYQAFLGRSLPPPAYQILGQWGVSPVFKPEESLDAQDDNVWLRGAVSRIVQEIARTKFKLRTVSPDGEAEQIINHQALVTLQSPQPIKGGKSAITGYDLKYITGQHILLAGDAFWVLQDRLKAQFGGAPTRIDIALPHYIYPNVNEQGDLVEYIYRLPQKELIFDPVNVIHFKIPSPKNIYRGSSPIKSLRYSLDTHQEADKLNLNHIKNGGVPAGILKPDGVSQHARVHDPRMDDGRRSVSRW